MVSHDLPSSKGERHEPDKLSGGCPFCPVDTDGLNRTDKPSLYRGLSGVRSEQGKQNVTKRERERTEPMSDGQTIAADEFMTIVTSALIRNGYLKVVNGRLKAMKTPSPRPGARRTLKSAIQQERRKG
jgi:hypothetical protein